MIEQLTNLANYLDKLGLKKEADRVFQLIGAETGRLILARKMRFEVAKPSALPLGPPEGEGFSPEHCEPGDLACWIEQTARERIMPGHYGFANLPMEDNDVLALDFPNAPEWQAAKSEERERIDSFYKRQEELRNSKEVRVRYKQYVASGGKDDFFGWLENMDGEGYEHYFGKWETKEWKENHGSLQLNGVFYQRPWAISDRLSPYLDLTPYEFTEAIKSGIEEAKRELSEGDTLEDIARLASKDLSNIPGLLEFQYSSKDIERIKDLLDNTTVRITSAADDGCSEINYKGSWSAGKIPNGILAGHEICINIFHWIYRFNNIGAATVLTQNGEGVRQFIPDIKLTAYHESWHAILEFALYIAKYEGLADFEGTPLSLSGKPGGYAPGEGSDLEYYSLFTEPAWEIADHSVIQNESAWIKKGLEFFGCTTTEDCKGAEDYLHYARKLAVDIWSPTTQQDMSHTIITIKEAKRTLKELGLSGETMNEICSIDGRKIYELTFYGQLGDRETFYSGPAFSGYSDDRVNAVLAVVLGIDCINGDPEVYEQIARLGNVEQILDKDVVPV